MNAIALPAVDGVASLDWDLDRNVANPMRSPLSRTIQRKVRSGDLWRCSLRFPLYDQDDAGVLAAWFDEASRGDRWMYLTPPHNTVRGSWGPAERVSNGTLLGGATTGWTGSGATLSVNARRLKITNSGAAAGAAYQEITCEANKPHVLMVDGFAGNTASLYAALRLTGGGAVEQDTYFTAPTRGVLLFYPSQAAMRLHLALESTTAGAYLYAGNVSVCRCLTVNGGGQTGTALNIDGGPASTNAALKAGEFVTLRVKNQWQLVRLKEDLDTDANGAGTLRFEPALRYTPVDGEAVIVRNPFVRAVLEENISRQSVTPPLFSAYTCNAIEDATELDGEIQSDLIWAWDAENETLAPQIGTGTPTFTRAGATATRVNASGLIEVVAADTPRFDYDPVTKAIRGLLIEEARTNLLLRSAELSDGAYWGGSDVAVSANAAVAPDGNLAADGLRVGTVNVQHYFEQNSGATAAGDYVFSVFVKQESARYVGIDMNDGAVDFAFAKFDFQTATCNSVVGSGATVSVQPHGNGWYRIILKGTKVGAVNGMRGRLFFSNTFSVDNGEAFAGDDTVAWYAWGAQLEVGAFPTSYIPTTSASVTRNADTCLVQTNLISGFDNDKQSYFMEFICPVATAGGYSRVIEFNTGAGTPCAIDSSFGVQTYDGAGGVSTPPGAVTALAISRVASAFDQTTDGAITANGATVSTGSAANFGAVSSLAIGGASSDQKLNGHLRKLRLYKRRKPNQYLKAISA